MMTTNLGMVGLSAVSLAGMSVAAVTSVPDLSAPASILGPIGALALMWYFLNKSEKERESVTKKLEAVLRTSKEDAMKREAAMLHSVEKSEQATQSLAASNIALATSIAKLADRM